MDVAPPIDRANNCKNAVDGQESGVSSGVLSSAARNENIALLHRRLALVRLLDTQATQFPCEWEQLSVTGAGEPLVLFWRGLPTPKIVPFSSLRYHTQIAYLGLNMAAFRVCQQQSVKDYHYHCFGKGLGTGIYSIYACIYRATLYTLPGKIHEVDSIDPSDQTCPSTLPRTTTDLRPPGKAASEGAGRAVSGDGRWNNVTNVTNLHQGNDCRV